MNTQDVNQKAFTVNYASENPRENPDKAYKTQKLSAHKQYSAVFFFFERQHYPKYAIHFQVVQTDKTVIFILISIMMFSFYPIHVGAIKLCGVDYIS